MDLRDPGRDYELYKYTCQELQRLMAEIQDLKSREARMWPLRLKIGGSRAVYIS